MAHLNFQLLRVSRGGCLVLLDFSKKERTVGTMVQLKLQLWNQGLGLPFFYQEVAQTSDPTREPTSLRPKPPSPEQSPF